MASRSSWIAALSENGFVSLRLSPSMASGGTEHHGLEGDCAGLRERCRTRIQSVSSVWYRVLYVQKPDLRQTNGERMKECVVCTRAIRLLETGILQYTIKTIGTSALQPTRWFPRSGCLKRETDRILTGPEGQRQTWLFSEAETQQVSETAAVDAGCGMQDTTWAA